ncbi:hypothetical protein E8E14_006395 [Neopestalotiopsis sp. 37M]|nr:hypothetical protein E8E14_006395 [Neopestalotiopsis sp. 37M]
MIVSQIHGSSLSNHAIPRSTQIRYFNHRLEAPIARALGVLLGACDATVVPRDNFRDWDSAVAKADELIAKFNLTEKQTFLTGKISLFVGGCIGNVLPIDRVGFKGLCLQDGPNGVNLADLVSVFPAGITVGATWDRDLFYARANAIGAEHKAKGIHIGLGPVAGPLGRHGRAGRNWEGFSVDPYLAGVAMDYSIRGQQDAGVQACAKHVVGNEQETQRSNTVSADGSQVEGISSNIDDRTLHELYLWPFGNAAKAGVASMMCSYNRLNQTYACENDHLLNGIIKTELGFPGYIMSDWYATHSGAKSINAGLDLNMPGGYSVETTSTNPDLSYWGSNITTMVQSGEITEDRLDDMLRRILTHYPTTDPSLGYSFAAWSDALSYMPTPYPVARDVRKDHAKLIRQIGAEATVLLKNTGNILPLQKKPLSIGVFGNDAADPVDSLVYSAPFDIGTLDIGSGAASVRHTYLVSPLEAIKKRVTADGGRLQYILHNTVLANNDFAGLFPIPDVCLVFLNGYAGENMDRTTYELDWNSTLVVESVANKCNNTIVVTHSPGVNTLPWAQNPNVKAILAAHYPGQETGNSIVDVLWGDVEPSGRLPYTIPVQASDYDIPIVNLTQEQVTSPTAWQSDFTEGLLIDYRKFDAHNVTPLYEFGFGLGYTSFEMEGALRIMSLTKSLTPVPDASKTVQPGGHPELWDDILRLTVTIKNADQTRGSTVAQLYVAFPQESVPHGTPVQVLRGFQKVRLGARGVQDVEFLLTRRDLSFWDIESQAWTIPLGSFSFRVGFSSRNIQCEAEHELLRK